MPRHALLLAALLLAGCLDQLAAPADEGPAAREAYFTSGMELNATNEAETTGVRAGSFFQAWAEGVDYPTWRAPAETRDVLVENVTVTLRIRATGPVLETARFPDVMIYGGSGEAWMGFGNATTPPVLAPGTVYSFDVPVAPPAGGLFVPAGERFGLKVVPVMHQNDVADVEILVGGEQGSRAAWTTRPLDLPRAANATTGADSGELRGSNYAGPAAPDTVRHRVAVQVNDTPVQLLAWMNTTEHQGIPDIDLSIVGPEGDELAFSGTPTPREMLRLAAPNLQGPGNYTLVATSYGSARAVVSIEWAVLAS